MRRVLFITRHSGAREWAKTHAADLVGAAEFIDHLPPARIATLSIGDIVVGTLPVHLIAEVNGRGARYLHLVIDLPAEAREKRDLAAEEMERYNARLESYFALSLMRKVWPEPDRVEDSSGKSSLFRRTYWRSKFMRLAGLLLALLAVLSGGFATNILTPVVTELIQPAGNPQTTNTLVIGAGVLFALILFLAAAVWFRLRNRVFTHYVVPRCDRVKEPCRVLITALSNDGVDPASERLHGDLLLEAVQSDPRLDVALFGRPKKKMEEELVKNGGLQLPPWRKANWLTNFVAIAAHAATLETLVIVPSKDIETTSGTAKGSIHRVDCFAQIAQILWSRSKGTERPLRVIAANPCDYDNYAELLDGIGEAIERGGAPRARDVSIDITSGTKPISVAGAVSTMNKDHTFIYVTNERHFWTFDAKIGIGEAFSL